MTGKLKNLLIYDNFQVAGGAEYVTKVLYEDLPFEKILVNYADPQVLNTLNLDESCVNTLSKPIKSVPVSMILSAFNFWRYRGDAEYGTVLVSGIFAPLIAKHIKARKIIYYCHTPPRFLYDLKRFYKDSLSPVQWLFLQAFSVVYKRLYESSFRYIDTVLANSKNVQNRLSHYLNVESEIVYPPCDTSYEGKESKGYFLSTARLEPYKRVDVIVDAFMQMPDKQLVVMSGGSLLEELKEKARTHPNVTFTGWVDEPRKRDLIAHCEATIYIPKDEDFGMSPVESLSAGKPVIGVNEGGLLETVEHNKHGLLCLSSRLKEQLSAYTIDFKEFNFSIRNTDVDHFDKKAFLVQLKKLMF